MMRENRFCFVNCGLPAHQCDCCRGQIAKIYADLLSKQEPLGGDFEKAWIENVKELYEP